MSFTLSHRRSLVLVGALIVVAVAILGAFSSSSAIAQEGWVIRSFDARYAVAGDGTFRVQEVILADFGSLGEWWPAGLLEKVEIEGAGIGMVRTLHTTIGVVLRERLDALYPDEHRLEPPLTGDLPVGMTEYHATGSVVAKGKDMCVIEWTGYYSVPSREAEEGARTFIEGSYRMMFKGIRDHVTKTAG